MKKNLVFIMFTLILLLTGCNKALTITKIKMDKVSSQLEEVIENNANDNGNYLMNNGKEQYVYFNRINVVQGEDAIVLSNFKTEVRENTLYVSFDEETTADYSNQDLQHQLLYKIKGGKDEYDTIYLMRNGESIHFDQSILY